MAHAASAPPATARQAAERAVALQLAWARRGTSLAQAALAGAHRCEWLRHYPAQDLVDAEAGTVALRAVGTANTWPPPAAHAPGEDPHMGNISFFATTIVKQLNAGIQRTGYTGGNMERPALQRLPQHSR